MAKFAHVDDFNRLADCFPAKNALEILGISDRTLRSWRAGARRIPWCAYQLLYDRSPYGLAERDSMERFERQMILGERDALQQKVGRLEAELVRQAALVDWGCANDPFILPSDPRSARNHTM